MISQTSKDKRKVQISGKSSCMVSLPKKWVNEMGLVQGSPLTITRHNSTALMISVDRTMEGKGLFAGGEDIVVLSIPPSEAPETTALKISCLYLQGFNLIKLKFVDNSLTSARKSSIRELIRRQLIGVEIISDSSDGLMVQILLGKSELSIENAMKRMSIVFSSMLEDAIASLISFDKKRALDVVQKDEIDRFASYASRHILGSLNHRVFKAGDDSEPEKLAVHLVIATAIQNAANCAREIASQVLRLDAPLDERNALELAKINETATSIFDSAVLSFFKRDSKAAEKTVESVKRFSDQERDFLETLIRTKNGIRNDEIVALVSTLGSLKKIVRYSSDISAQVLGLSVEQFVEIEDGRRQPKRVMMNEVPLVRSSSYEI
jgi:phosphate uptake regulator